jgi:hypothetical protein
VDLRAAAGRIAGLAKTESKSCGPIQITLSVYSASDSPSLVSETEMATTGGAFEIDFSKKDNTALILTFQQIDPAMNNACRSVLEWKLVS